MTFSYFRDIINYYPYAFLHIYIFNYKGELISYCTFITNKNLESEEKDKKLLSKERDEAIAKLRNSMLTILDTSYLFKKPIFYMYISKDEL
jgi:hypothetical protein